MTDKERLTEKTVEEAAEKYASSIWKHAGVESISIIKDVCNDDFFVSCFVEGARWQAAQDKQEIEKLREALGIAKKGLESIYSDGSYEDIASEFAEEAIKQIGEILGGTKKEEG